MPTPRRAPARPRTLRRAIRLARTAYLREETTSEHAETNAELGEVEGGAERRRSAGNTASGARGAPMASGGTVRAERRQESARESEGARTGWRREWRGRWRCPQRRRRRPDAVGRARRGRVRARAGRGWTRRGRPGLASLAGPVGWRRPASEQLPLSFFFEILFPNSFLKLFGPAKKHFHLLLPKTKLFQNKNSTTLL
jgi:hypothetical protein